MADNNNDQILTHPLHFWLAEQCASLMIAIEAAELNERNTRERHRILGDSYEEERREHRAANDLLQAQVDQNNLLILSNDRLRQDLEIATTLLHQQRAIIRAYRMSSVPLLRPRTLPTTFLPTLRRIREEEEERRRVRTRNGDEFDIEML